MPASQSGVQWPCVCATSQEVSETWFLKPLPHCWMKIEMLQKKD